MASIQLPDTIADALQKASVMGDEHDGTLKHSDLLFKPVDGGDVEVVGWFVQKQNIGFDDQGSGKRGPPTPPARECCKLLVGIQAQLLKYLVDSLLH